MNASVGNTVKAQETLAKSSIAWGMIGSIILAILGWAAATCAVIILVFGSLDFGIARLTQIINDKNRSNNRQQAKTPTPSFFRELGKCVLYIFIPSYGIFCAMFFISVILIATLSPFVFVGKKSAANDLEDGFKNSPIVTVADPDGKKGVYRVMQRSTTFCARYTDGKAITVPISTLNGVVSDVSDQLKQHTP